MKAYSFSFNTSDWLASPAVRLMSKAERGVYINLLALAWEAPLQGTLPASADKVRRMAEMNADEWAESGEVILDKFPLSDCGTYRYNPRLVIEREKQEAKREVNAEAGRRSAEKRAAEKAAREAAATKGQRKANEKATSVEYNPTDVEDSSTNSRVELSRTTSLEVVVKAAAPEALKAKSKAQQANDRATAEGTDTFTAETWIGLNDPQQFATICKSLTALKLPANLDTEAYRESIRRKVADRGMDVPASTMRNFIESFFMKLPTAELRTVNAALPTVPTPEHELPPLRQERPGQIIAFQGVGHDETQNRMKIATYQGYWPTAQIHAILPR